MRLRTTRYGRVFLLCLIAAFPAEAVHAGPVADPSRPAVGATVSGQGTPKVTINQHAAQAIINWRSFNIAPNEVTQFIQPSTSAIALNRIADVNPSQIFGSLQANGIVMLLNPNGVLFGPTAQVNVGGLIASSLHLTDSQFLKGEYLFQGAAINGPVKNAGTIQAGAKGVYLLAPNTENSGVITSPEGHVALAAGTTAYLSDRPDGRGLLVEVKAPAGEAVNLKDLVADGGQVSLIGSVVKQQGLVQANSVREKNGRIELYASQQLTLGAGSRTAARGAEEGVSDGGTVIALADKSQGTATFERGALVDVSGGKQGGNAGFAELSGSTVQMGGQFVGKAAEGYKGGKVLIDPTDFTADANFFNSFAGSGASEIKAEADNNITVAPGFVDLAAGGFKPSSGTEGDLIFKAGNDILFDGGFLVNGFTFRNTTAQTKWNYIADAGNDILINEATIWTGKGGNIDFTAGRDIRLQDSFGSQSPSYLRAVEGGNISLRAKGIMPDLDDPSKVTGDIVIPHGFDRTFGLYSGVRVDGQGDITLTAHGSILGGDNHQGQSVGPGLTLSNGTARLTAETGTVGSPEGYANFTVGKPKVIIDAKSDVYLGLVQDQGAAEKGTAGGISRPVVADPNGSLEVWSREGDIHFKPELFDTRQQFGASTIYPASLTAKAGGSIFVESSLSLWPSLTGTLNMTAHRSIEGVPTIGQIEDPSFLPRICGQHICSGLEMVQLGFAKTIVEGESLQQAPLIPGVAAKPTIGLSPADPAKIVAADASQEADFATLVTAPSRSLPDHQPATVQVQTETGDISTVGFEFFTGAINKLVSIISGRDMRVFSATVSVPEGRTAKVQAAGDIDMTAVPGQVSGGQFFGKGEGQVMGGGNLDLANSQGITHQLDVAPNFLTDQGGLVSITSGRNVEMTRSKIFTYNGASIFIHGEGEDPVTPTPATLVGQALFVGEERIVDLPANAQVINTGSFLLSGGRPVLRDGNPVTRGAQLSLDGHPISYQGRVVLKIDGQVLLVDPALVKEVRPMPGFVNVGTNASFGQASGIVTVGGGNIDIKAAGDVNVNQSRVATLGGGEIGVTSTLGDINAGSGGANEAVEFRISQLDIDPLTGLVRKITLPDGTEVDATVTRIFFVPGSGIFTFHPDDPAFPLPYPRFDTAEIAKLKNEIVKQSFLGRDVSAMNARVVELSKVREPEFNRIFDDFIAPLKLGDITLTAGRNIVVPPAGIRGRDVSLFAGQSLDLQGGQVQGRVKVKAKEVIGQQTNSFFGNFTLSTSSGTSSGASTAGGGSVAPLSGTTSATASSSATASTSSTASGNTSSVKESSGDATTGAGQAAVTAIAKAMRQQDTGEKRRTVRAKQGVTIKVEAKPKQQ